MAIDPDDAVLPEITTFNNLAVAALPRTAREKEALNPTNPGQVRAKLRPGRGRSPRPVKKRPQGTPRNGSLFGREFHAKVGDLLYSLGEMGAGWSSPRAQSAYVDVRYGLAGCSDGPIGWIESDESGSWSRTFCE